MLGFRIYYGDGTVRSGTTLQEWHEIPADDVQVVLLFLGTQHPDGWDYATELHSHDYYWFNGVQYGITNRASEIPRNCSVKTGKWADHAAWLAVYNRAHKDRKWL